MILSHFARQGYPNQLLTATLSRVSKIPRETLLQPKTASPGEQTTKFFALSTYNPTGNVLRTVITANWHLLQRSGATRDLHDKKVVFGQTRNKNLRDLLTRSKIDYHPEAAPHPTDHLSLTSNACQNRTCRYCPLLDKLGTIHSTSRNQDFFALKNFTCKSHNLIYCITCTRCHIQYVGQTKRRLMERFQGHFYNVKKKQEQIGRHFTSEHHEGTKDMRIHALSFIHQPGNSTAAAKARDKTELSWIHRLCTQAPFGLNILE